jgi:hypothetical protein
MILTLAQAAVFVISQIALHKLIISVQFLQIFAIWPTIFLQLRQNANLVVHFGPKLKKRPILEIGSTTSVRVSQE